jgi:actin-related protein 3
MADDTLTPVVIDNGTGFTKMGYAGMKQPQCTIPTCLGLPLPRKGKIHTDSLSDLDFYIGTEAQDRTSDYGLHYPIVKGKVENWDHMEKLWQRCFFRYLKCEPENHHVLLTEAPQNAPENRELCAEIMFETFNVSGLKIAISAALAVRATYRANLNKYAAKHSAAEVAAYKADNGFRKTTGCVVDSGDGLTNVVPVYCGRVLGSCIRKIEVAGSDVTESIKQMLRDRREPVPPEMLTAAATRIKENHCYICKDIVKEFQLYDKDPANKFIHLSGIQRRTKEPWQCNVGYECFLGPEVFFQPEIFSADISTPLAIKVDEAVLESPVDCRADLWNNIVLAGGSTMFKSFHRRLALDIRRLVTARLKHNYAQFNLTEEEQKNRLKNNKLTVDVVTSSTQKYASWFGGSLLATDDNFKTSCVSRARYLEEGPRVARVF